MNQNLIENLKNRLRNYEEAFFSCDIATIDAQIISFLDFITKDLMLFGILQNLLRDYPALKQTDVSQLPSMEVASTANRVAINYQILRILVKEKKLLRHKDTIKFIESPYRLLLEIIEPFNASRSNLAKNTNKHVKLFCTWIIRPIIRYLEESLDDSKLKLFFLLRYKHRSEWFKGAYLSELVQRELERVEQEYKKRQEEAKKKGTDEKKVPRPKTQIEKILAQDLYAYLFDEGLEFYIEPSSLRGEVDLIEAQTGQNRLLLDVKVFDNESRNKAYLLKAFYQIYTYTRQYNQPMGYLVIFKTCKDDLDIATRQSEQGIPFVQYNHKTIFLLTIDIHQYIKPVSQRPGLTAVQILEEEFVVYLEENPLPLLPPLK